MTTPTDYSGFPFGTTTQGTLRSDDLEGAMVDHADDIKAFWQAKNMPEHAETVGYIDTVLGEVERETDTEQNVETLTILLEELAPPYFYFSTNPGDGAEFGFWPDWDALREINHVADSSELDSMGGAEAVHVNDHGNTSLYARGSDGAWYQIWSIV